MNPNSVAKTPRSLYKGLKNRYPKQIADIPEMFVPLKEPTLEEMKGVILVSVVLITIPLE